jgi:hypothetical protein
LLFKNDKGKLTAEVPVAQGIARPPPKGQVAGSNPARDAIFIKAQRGLDGLKIVLQGACRVQFECVIMVESIKS